jgi:hypothetical protein
MPCKTTLNQGLKVVLEFAVLPLKTSTKVHIFGSMGGLRP